MRAGFTFYDVLGVDSDADLDAIKAAYHAAIKRIHPDVDRGEDAHDAAVEIILAYRTLSDPARRRKYDRLTARLALTGGESLRRLLLRRPTREILRLPADAASIVHRQAAAAVGRERARQRRWIAVGAAATLSIAFVLTLCTVAFFAPHAAGQRPVRSGAPVVAVRYAALAPFPISAAASACLDDSRGLRGDALYRQCVQTRAKLRLALRETPSPAARERLALEAAAAEMRQALGARESKKPGVSEIVAQAVASFAAIERTATDRQVRGIAAIFVECYTHRRCSK